MSIKEKLFDQFPPVTTKEWMDKINSDLKGADFKKKLVWKTDEGFEVKPFYRAEDIEDLSFIDTLPGEYPYTRGTKIRDNKWYVRQNIEVNDYSEANRKALEILMKGIDSLGFILADPESVSENTIRQLLKDIHIESVELNFLCYGKAKEILDHLTCIISERGLNRDDLRGAIEADPIGRLIANGSLCAPVDSGFDYLATLAQSAASLPNLRIINLNASVFNNAGTDIIQELAFGISMGNEYISQLTERGLKADSSASKIRFCFGTGSNYFSEIAKLRAARLLWSLVQQGYSEDKGRCEKMEIHCVTSRWNKTVYDPYVNMLRTQTEAMSAILGGTDSLTVEPFDAAFRKSEEFSERIARNQQLILKEEAYFDKVADPSAGSYYIENLTNLFAEGAWKLFLEIEENGGFISALNSGMIQKMVKEAADIRKKEIASRKKILLGTNQYPNNNESVSPAADLDIVFGKEIQNENLIVNPIKTFRASEEYEKLRVAVDRAGRRPEVFLLQIGNSLMRKARAQFSAGFFGCAGYHIIESNGFESVDDAIASVLQCDADIVVICSSDEEYPVLAPDIYTRLKDIPIIVVAGNPPSIEELKSKGLNSFIHMKSDVIETLSNFNYKLGIKM